MTIRALSPAPVVSFVPRDTEDHRLMQRTAAGDSLAFDTLYQHYVPRLRRYLQPRLGSPDLVEEVCQDVMLVVWRRAGQFEPTFRLSTWMFGIARRLALKVCTRAAARAAEPPALPVNDALVSEPALCLDQAVCRQAVAHAVAALPPHLCQTVRLRYYHDCSYAQIAAQMGCAEGTVKDRLRQARQQLSAALIRKGYPASVAV